ncbi:hypothetical protein KDN32_17780 [Nocardioides sp. J2M5]|uniref:hypothetical protein n=1 Tax=Nocardioides palaemonis TaxID=2829810 RepID=UPI001BAB1F0F|nr:hypothetical protein [Nocardioides palaemonis]MBS2939593.1 hypothetical protein [Nocardioides palaemonis]
MSLIAETATLAHGFTMADVEKLTRRSLFLARPSSALTHSERHETAWFRIVELIYSSADRPEEYDLARAGADAVHRAVQDTWRFNGRDPRERRAMPAFERYWVNIRSNEDFTDGIAERLSLPAVLSSLTPLEYEAVAALAAHGSSVAAARALGVTSRAFGKRVAKARAKILPLWYAPETARATTTRKRPDTEHCTVGHDLGEHGRVTPSGYTVCRRCERNEKRRANARTR